MDHLAKCQCIILGFMHPPSQSQDHSRIVSMDILIEFTCAGGGVVRGGDARQQPCHLATHEARQDTTRHPTANNFTNDLASLTLVCHAAQTERDRETETNGVNGWNRKATGIVMRCTNKRFYQKVARDAVSISLSLRLPLCILIHSDHTYIRGLSAWLVTWQQVRSAWLQKMPINATITDQVQFTVMPC